MKKIYPLIIDGKRVKTSKIFTVKNPATDEISDKFCVAGEKEIALAIGAARAAQAEWAKTSVKKRVELFQALEKTIIRHAPDLMRIATTESGKTHAVALMDTSKWLDIIDYYCKNAKKFLEPERHPKLGSALEGKYEGKIIYEPLGVVAILIPWNWPICLAAFSMVPAIMAGNAIIYKPSEYSGYLGYKITEIYEEAGFPPGLINLLNGTGSETGELITKSTVDKLVFTGGTATGARVAKNCAENLTPCVLELGGLDPMIICRDANLEEATNAAVWGNFINSGHTCMAPKRFYVHNSIYKKFVEMTVARAKKLRVGPPHLEGIDMGPIAHEKQFKKIEEFVADAIKKGAKLEFGGKRLGKKGIFYSPTILTNIKPNMIVVNEEPFGPIMPIMPFNNEENAIKAANNTVYGLGASIWSRDLARAELLAKKIEAGMIWINEIIIPMPQLHFGGIKKSGIGRELGKEGFREFVRSKSILKRMGEGATRSWWFPFSENTTNTFREFFFGYLHSHKGAKKLSSMLKLIKSLPQQSKNYKKFKS